MAEFKPSPSAPADDLHGGEVLPPHVEESVDAIASFHEQHYRAASGLRRGMEWLTDQLARPLMVALIALAVASWVVVALIGPDRSPGQPALAWLELAATVGALFVAMLILVTQRHQEALAERRARLTLELGILADRKTAKIIALLEELRRDHPDVADRVDAESDDMARPSDPEQVLAAIDERAADERRAP